MGRKKARRSAANSSIRLVVSAPAGGSTPRVLAPSDSDIAMRAYEKWLERGRPFGDGQRDWFAAQDELRRERGVFAALN